MLGPGVETHIHILDRETGKPALGVRIYLVSYFPNGEYFNREYFETTGQDGYAKKEIAPQGFTLKRDGVVIAENVRRLGVQLDSARYELVEHGAEIKWESGADLARGYVILVKKKTSRMQLGGGYGRPFGGGITADSGCEAIRRVTCYTPRDTPVIIYRAVTDCGWPPWCATDRRVRLTAPICAPYRY